MKTLTGQNLSMADVVKMQGFPAGPTKEGRMDFADMMAGYPNFFGSTSPPSPRGVRYR